MVSGAGLRARSLTVAFGSTRALDDVALDVEPGEIVAVLGPSGCGKSTLLRVLAGLQPSAGTVAWQDEDLTRARPDRRRFGLMFQDHALFPHRSVAENVAFGLRMAGLERTARDARVADVLDLVGLGARGDRSVDTLSGGEAQRVALARSLAPAPRLLMLDEPLGSLDRALRDRLAEDLREILVTSGLAAVHVTHDQEEAYAIADRLVVMRDGRIVRDGAAAQVWAEPGSAFVARFLGHDNVLDASAAASLGLAVPADRAVVVPDTAIEITVPDPGGAEGSGGNGTVVDVRFRGSTSRVDLAVDGGPLLRVHRRRPPRPGERVAVRVDPGSVVTVER